MAPNLPALRAYLARLTKATPPKKARDACDAVMPGGASTYLSRGIGTLVTPASAFKYPHLVHEEGACRASSNGNLEEREAMALEGGVSPAFARVFAALQVARPASVDVARWYQAINDFGVFLDSWSSTAERLGWTARDIISPQFTPTALAWALQGAQVIGLTATSARLSDGRTFVRASAEEIIMADIKP
ncbi:hypothetical protein ACFOYU_19310 [Microvirga sp. GCM10011540]|uniref:hypothetical protein n=1 Tax=Microvirga sp. GCM10011540 TaxID=3317338 RepID=UPI00361837CB